MLNLKSSFRALWLSKNSISYVGFFIKNQYIFWMSFEIFW